MIIDKKREIRFLQRESILLKAVSALIYKLTAEIPSLMKISITEIKLSKDLSHAKVYMFSSFGREVVDEVIEALIPYVPSIRSSLPAVAELRRIPNLRLVHDINREKINKIETLLDSVKVD